MKIATWIPVLTVVFRLSLDLDVVVICLSFWPETRQIFLMIVGGIFIAFGNILDFNYFSFVICVIICTWRVLIDVSNRDFNTSSIDVILSHDVGVILLINQGIIFVG
jgi:hypothetical protein